ncbi:MAG TPA: hypothetical protein DC054_09960 [Blastocatellia bacterium]|nr:hypothetical protein [Blastocatellia bacterium]
MAQAQATRTWVSGVGDDANPCSRTAPCKTFAGAISKTAVDGEIDALDPGGFGAVTVTKSITIDGSATGVAGILNATTTGVIVNITAETAPHNLHTVVLRAISFQGAGSGTQGINIVGGNVSGSRVIVENCFIAGNNGSPGSGITDVRINGGTLEVYNTTIINNSGNGISMNPSSNNNSIHLHMQHCRVSGNGASGVFLGSAVQGFIYDTVITQNNQAGVFVQQTAGGNTNAEVDHCVVSNNITGFQANTTNSIIRVSNTTALGNNNLAITAGAGAVSSYGNNQTGGGGFPSAATVQQ